MDIDDWLDINLSNKTRLDASLEWCNVWSIGCHSLWMWRNKEMHDADFMRPPRPAGSVLQMAHDYERGRVLLPGLSCATNQVHVRWSRPLAGWVAINTDGAVKFSLGVAGCGGAVRDENGGWLGGFVKRLFVTTAYLAELWGAMEGITLALNKGFSKIELQMDSTSIVNYLNGSEDSSIAGRHLLRRIRQLLSCFTSVRIIHIYREASKVVDEIANMGCTYDTHDTTLFVSPPPIVRLLVDAVVIGVSTPCLIPV